MFKENGFNESDELIKIRKDAAEAEASLNRTVMKQEFLNRVSEKYKEHTKLLTNLKNFNHMLKETNKINICYSHMLENINNPEFDFISFENDFDNLVAENMSKAN